MHPVIKVGGKLQLKAGTTNVGPTPRYQWRLNQAAIPGATNPVWEIGTLRSTESGTYEVYMSNLFGVTTSVVAEVAARLADLQVMTNLSEGRFGLLYPEATPEELSLEATENLKDWQRLRTFTRTNATWLWDEEAGSRFDRFFRVVPSSMGTK